MEITPMQTMHDIYNDGIILILQTGCWGAQTKLPQEKIAVQTAREYVAGTKRVVDYEKYLRPIKKNQDRATRYVKRESVPGLPVTAAHFIPRGSLQYVCNTLESFHSRHRTLVQGFLPLYGQMKVEARQLLEPDGLFDEADYPQEIESRFHFSWKLIELHPPGSSKVLSPEMLQHEREKLAQTFEEFRTNAVTILRSEFAKSLNGLAEALKSGNARRIRQESLDSLHEWMNRFERLNINDDHELAELVDRMRGITQSTTAAQLKENSVFRRSVCNHMDTISEAMGSLLETVPRRRIVLAKKAVNDL